MSISSVKSGLALVLAVLCLGGRTAHAQTAPVTYWTPGWPIGLGGTVTGQSFDTYGNFPSFDGRDVQGGQFSYARYNFPNGWFVGSERGGMGFAMNGIASGGAFGNLHYEGTQFGYNFQNAPITVYGGLDTLKYDSGIGGALGTPFDSTSSTLPGYSAHMGVEFRPTSNLSLSLGASYTQQSGDINSLVLPGASPFGFGGRR